MNGSSWRSWFRVGATFFILAVMVPATFATTWDETTNGGGDAGDHLPSAQVTFGSGPLTSITGANSDGTDGDLYRIYLPNPADFVATTVGGAGHDTILYLFDTAGHVWVAQDDDTGFQSTIFFAPGQPTPPPGNFYLGITTWNIDIRDANEVNMFAAGYDEYFGTSPITGNFLSLWTNTTFEFDHFTYFGYPGGQYTIELRNAEYYIPEPAGMLLVLTCIGGLMAARRRKPFGILQ